MSVACVCMRFTASRASLLWRLCLGPAYGSKLTLPQEFFYNYFSMTHTVNQMLLETQRVQTDKILPA